jgi:molecular chaperone GrpE
VELIHRDFLAALERLGVRPFVAVGQPFDPTRHEAVSRVERTDVDDHTVVAEPLRGYLFQERVLRPAQVVVAVHPAGAASGAEGAA